MLSEDACVLAWLVLNSVLELRCALIFIFCNEWYHTLVLAGDSSHISGNVTVTECLLESPLARFKKFNVVCCFINSVFARVHIKKNGNILLLLSSLLVSCHMKESQKFLFSRNFPALVTSKTSKWSATKATSLLLPQTPGHLLKPPFTFNSRRGDSLTVGYNISHVKISSFNTSRWNGPQLY